MIADTRFAGYVQILRKHVVVLAVSVLLVGAAGAVYLQRQQPVFRAEALLKIEQPVPNLLGGAGARNWFAISQAALNTELYLLRAENATAELAIARLREQGLGEAADSYTPASLTGNVSVEPLAGTEGLVRFSLTGPGPVTLPAAVNAYAREYAASTMASRSRTFDLQRAALERARRAAAAAETTARAAVAAYRTAHVDVDVEAGENPAAHQRALLAAQLPALERAALEDDLARRRIVDALTESGLMLPDDPTSRLRSVDGTSVADALADSPFVAGLPGVRGNAELQRLRTVEEEARTRDSELGRQGVLTGHEQRESIRARIDATRALRVRVIETAIRTELREIAARAAHLEATKASEALASAEDERVAAVLAGYREVARALADAERVRADAEARLQDLSSMFLTGEDGESGDARADSLPSLRVELRVPATSAKQVAPRASLAIGLTVFAALATGLGLAFVLEYLDDTIRSKDDFDRYVGLPLLGFVPRISPRDHDNLDVAAGSRPGTSVAEAFRAIRTSVVFSRGEHPVRVMLVTSAGPGEGKTTVATNLATAFARHRGPVLLIDADLRKPRVAAALGVDDERGLTNVLVGDATLEDVVQKSQIEGLHVLTSGPIPPNPAELLHGDAMSALLREAASKYERVILDTPPLVAVTDARVLAGQVDGFYLVISMGKTSRRLIQRAMESLTGIGFTIHAAVLNNTLSSQGRYGDYTYYARDYRRE